MSIFWNTPAFSMPAFPGDISYIQPDGTIVKYKLKGDEHFHWMESLDGHVLKRSDNGYLVYAEAVDDQVVASSVPYTGNDHRASSRVRLLDRRGLMKMQQATNPSLQLASTFPPTGQRKLLMLLVNFADTQTTFGRDDFDAMMNTANYQNTGSFRDFYLENSYGQLDIQTTVVGWIQLSKNKNMYSTENMTELISEALTLVQDEIDFSQFDNNGDGELDGLSIIHQGTGQEVTGSTQDIWSHSGELYDTWVDGIRVRTYTIQPELLYNVPMLSMMTVGVFCHEFGHNLGAPDFYDVDYEQNGSYVGTGEWDLMGGGAWGTYGRSGDSPCHYTMWQKIQFGWVTPTVLSESQTIDNMQAVTDGPVAYVINTMRDGDYFVLENRQKSGFDRSLPGHGLVIYHADESRIAPRVNLNKVNSSSEQGLYTVCASANTLPGTTPESYGNINSGGAPFPGTSNVTTLSDVTVPALHSNDGKYSYAALNDIVENNGRISFSFVKGDEPEGVGNLVAAAKQGVVTLTWERPTTGSVRNYRVFRNNELVAQPTTESYVDRSLTATQAEYKVDVVYTDGLYSSFVHKTVRVPENRIEELEGNSLYGETVLQWSLNPLLTRSSITIGNENVSFHALDGAEVDVAQRFNAADLKTYVGYRFDRLGFLPFTSYKQTVYELRVWRAVAGTDDFEVVATRDASEYATGSWRDMLLKDPVEIEAGYDYLIGYHASSNVNSFQVVYDPTSVDTGLGNLVQVDGVWRDDLLPANVYFRANLAEPDPTTDFVAGEEPVFKDDYDPLKDAYYPIGFNVYRDDELIGYTSTRCFIDKGASVGNHRYGIACLYEGNNESRILEKTFWASSVDRVEADRRVELSVAGRVVTVTADEPIAVSLYTVDGRRVASYALPAGESTFAVESAGVYLVNLENSNLVQTEKIIIR